MDTMNIQQKLALLKRNSQEIVTEEELEKLLKEKDQPAVYLGTAITGRPHVGYFLWVLKMADFLKCGFKVKLLLADIHGALDRTPWNVLDKRFEYYSKVIPAMFEAIGSDIKNFEIIKGSNFQLEKEYVLDMLKMATEATVHDCKKASSDVVKQVENPKIAGLIYPIMQSLDEQYLSVDVQYGGIDQRKILMFAREHLPKLGYKPRVEFMTPLIPALSKSGKMSASDKTSKIDLIDPPEEVNKKMNAAFCPEGQTEGNGVLAFCRYVIMTLKQDSADEFIIERPEKWGGNQAFKTYDELESAFVKKELHPQDLKQAVAREINKLLDPIRNKMENHQELVKEAYPDE